MTSPVLSSNCLRPFFTFPLSIRSSILLWAQSRPSLRRNKLTIPTMAAPGSAAEAIDALNLNQLSLGQVKHGRNATRRPKKKFDNAHRGEDAPPHPAAYAAMTPPASAPMSFDRWLGAARSSTAYATPSPTKPLPAKAKKPKTLNQAPLQHLPAPTPLPSYLSLASLPLTRLPTPQRLLLVLDLNGTLLHRPYASSTYLPRPSLSNFLAYCLANHTVLVWSSATPTNVSAICRQLFRPQDRKSLLGEWARDTLGLTPDQYTSRVQVYKRLDRIWNNASLSTTHPQARQEVKWSQANTLLIDDSHLKASAQPHNLVQIPEFVAEGGGAETTQGMDVLAQVVGYLEEARRWADVSAFVKQRRFEVDAGWGWDWDKGQGDMTSDGVVPSDDDDEGEGGGVLLAGWTR